MEEWEMKKWVSKIINKEFEKTRRIAHSAQRTTKEHTFEKSIQRNKFTWEKRTPVYKKKMQSVSDVT
jgi:hypothetical protein